MIPVDFPQRTMVLQSPNDGSVDCLELPVYAGPNVHGQPVMTSCWKPNKEEIDELLRTGCIYLTIYGKGHPPVWLSCINPFVAPLEIMVSKTIVDKTAVCVLQDNQYVLSKLPYGINELRITEFNGSYCTLFDSDGILSELEYDYYEPVKIVGIGSELEQFASILEDLKDKGFEPDKTVVLLRTTKNVL